MLNTLPENQKKRWDQHVSKVVHAYNCTKNDATGFSPFFLLFGPTARLLIDLMFGCNQTEDRLKHKGYVEKWSRAMNDAYVFASKHAAKNSSRRKNYDKGARYSTLKLGDRVLVRNLSERHGPGKLRSHWENDIHVVASCVPDNPVYEVKPEVKDGRKRLLHRNLLLPCDFLPLTPEPEVKRILKTPRMTNKVITETLLNRKFIRKSKSAYSSPVVCVRKKDGSLSLCVDFRKLNRRSITDRHPLPTCYVQTTLENLGGNSWFSLLDQGKAYQQGFKEPPPQQHKTAFITPWGLYEW